MALAIGCLCLLWLFPHAAKATFPGKPGMIVFNLWIDNDSGPTGGLYSIAVGDDKPQRLTHRLGDSEPSFAPSGRRFAFHRRAKKGPGIYVFDLRSGQARRIVKGISLGNPAFGRNGTIAFTRANGYSSSLILRTASGDFRRLFSASTVAVDDPVFMPDGKRIIFVGYEHHDKRYIRVETIYSIRTDGTGLRRLRKPRRAYNLDISPNGRNLAFGNTDDFTGRVWKAPIAGRGVRSVSRNGGGFPAFSPGGRKIAYSNYWGVWIGRANGAGRPVHAYDTDPDSELVAPPTDLAWQPLPR